MENSKENWKKLEKPKRNWCSIDFYWFCLGFPMILNEIICFALVFQCFLMNICVSLWFSYDLQWNDVFCIRFSMLFRYLLKCAYELILSSLMWSESPYPNQWNLLWTLIIKMPFEFEATFLLMSYCVWKKEVMMKTNRDILMDPSVIAMVFVMR